MDYEACQPTGFTKEHVYQLAEAYADEVGFLPGDRIEPLIQRLGGVIEYLPAAASLSATDGSLYVHGPGSFRIIVSALTGAERDRFTIAHELGHYVLHSQRGERRVTAARYGSDRAEWEANWFAAAFLMPKDDFIATCRRYSNDVRVVAARYLVSPKAAEVRMTALGI